MKLITFTGSMGSGKSTAIKCLAELSNTSIHLVKFAQPLYDMQEYIYNRIETVYKRPADFVKDRRLLQFLGTDWARGSIDKDIWIKIWKEEVKFVLESYPNHIVVADDVRFDNEGEIVKSLGGIVIKVESNKNSDRININAGIAGHASEAGLQSKNIDYILINNGTIDDLKTSLLALNAQKALW